MILILICYSVLFCYCPLTVFANIYLLLIVFSKTDKIHNSGSWQRHLQTSVHYLCSFSLLGHGYLIKIIPWAISHFGHDICTVCACMSFMCMCIACTVRMYSYIALQFTIKLLLTNHSCLQIASVQSALDLLAQSN